MEKENFDQFIGRSNIDESSVKISLKVGRTSSKVFSGSILGKTLWKSLEGSRVSHAFED